MYSRTESYLFLSEDWKAYKILKISPMIYSLDTFNISCVEDEENDENMVGMWSQLDSINEIEGRSAVQEETLTENVEEGQ